LVTAKTLDGPKNTGGTHYLRRLFSINFGFSGYALSHISPHDSRFAHERMAAYLLDCRFGTRIQSKMMALLVFVHVFDIPIGYLHIYL
jgi:hypothetical protein